MGYYTFRLPILSEKTAQGQGPHKGQVHDVTPFKLPKEIGRYLAEQNSLFAALRPRRR